MSTKSTAAKTGGIANHDLGEHWTDMDLSPQNLSQEITQRQLHSDRAIRHTVFPNYRRLQLLNRGEYNWLWENKNYTHHLDESYLVDSICSQLELTKLQKSRVRIYLNALNPQKLGIAKEKVIFGLCALSCRKDGRRYYPHPDSSFRDHLFVKFAEEQCYEENDILSWIGKLRHRLRDNRRFQEECREEVRDPIDPAWWSLHN